MVVNSFFVKDPGEARDYYVDWTARLSGDTIVTSTFTAETGIVVGATTFTTTRATYHVSGGTAGFEYQIVNRITTALGDVLEQTITFLVEQK